MYVSVVLTIRNEVHRIIDVDQYVTVQCVVCTYEVYIGMTVYM